ncbi:MAG: hypothetical protein H8E54_04960, partial [Candidatus Aminicenantes bacterium]|nr:hypothetical protein [Candidatus Aminicenantes bacterium]
QGLPVCASRTISIRQNYLIRQIIALLKFLNSPIDNLCFANFILGEIFIKATQLNIDVLQPWLENLRINQDSGVLYTQFRSTFPDVWQKFLQYLFNAVGFLPTYDLVETIFINFKVEDNFPHLTGFARRLLEILNNLQEQGKNSLSEFLEWFDHAEEEELFVQLPSGLDAIKILTIHKAKGLSSPVVILPFAALEVKVGEAAKVVHETVDGLYLLYLQKDICQNHPELTPIYQREYLQALLDELNCLYVGLTRAASELYIFLPGKINRTDNPLVSLFFGQQGDFKELGKRVASPYATQPKDSPKELQWQSQPHRVLPQGVFKDILKAQLIPLDEIISPERRYLAKRAEVLHYLLAEIDPFSFLDNPSSYIPRVEDACRLFNYSDSEEIIQRLSDFLKEPKIQSFFGLGLKAFNEKEVVDQYGNLKRIDRLVFTEDRVLIIDYKTGEQLQEEHQEQIREYARLIKELYPDKLPEAHLVYIDTKQIYSVAL